MDVPFGLTLTSSKMNSMLRSFREAARLRSPRSMKPYWRAPAPRYLTGNVNTTPTGTLRLAACSAAYCSKDRLEPKASE